jgi:hypothetical protein
VANGLARTERLLQPLRHRTFTIPALAMRAALAARWRLSRKCCSKIIRADSEVLHAVAEVGNHTVALAFIHETVSLSGRYPVFFSIAGGNAENADPLVTGDGVKLFAGTENDID